MIRPALLLAFVTVPALAADGASALPDAGGVWRAMLGLAVVLGSIFAIGWLMRKLAPLRAGAAGPLRVVASQPLGARERVVLLELGDHWFIVGVAPGRVSALASVPRAELPPAPAGAHPFSSLLARAALHGRDAKA